LSAGRPTRALSLSRLAYDLENIVSPMLASLLLAVISYNALFFGTMVWFAASAALVLSIVLSSPKPSEPRGIYDRPTRGICIYLATPSLRGLLALTMAAAGAAMVLVNLVMLARGMLDKPTASGLDKHE
jgi:hypothetical protein